MGSAIQQDCTSSKFRRIGQGFCGTVWAAEGGKLAMKREDGGPGRSLLNDYNMHTLVLETASQQKVNVRVPRWPEFFKSEDGWWGMRSNRLHSLQRALRRTQPTTAAGAIATIKANDADRDCLVRPYLGRRKIQNETRRGRNFFSLRNYPLHLNQAEDLDLPILEYSHGMAEILAMMHWTAKIDANDIEFVLGGVQPQPEIARKEYTHDFLGTHSLWVLDFDCCKPLTMDDAGIDQAARAFLRNDPTLWIEFRTRYLECSQNFVTGTGVTCLGLPEKFIARVAEMHQKGTEQSH
ncbi:hypothetical protein G647_03173 [Cladophialophora carrionii CBS 160.54]|uniref:DUF3669 domain-containing protein n=1 Tax=Cladophialophora carrionii CBS 160.54 TaxID=1279043 RepID=V9DIB4_9EURO|nr:uncharacterized protein G647_03173 [Cladophialophora carrionii CBS 160.54]ETI26396.1 hypothetical protein G647_03173 [Cladophialophora carrionii CBS 160.54]